MSAEARAAAVFKAAVRTEVYSVDGGGSRCGQDPLRTLGEKPSCLVLRWVAPGHPALGTSH